MFRTPDYNLKSSEYDSVYDPSEDSFILLDALEADVDLIKSSNPSIIAEIGVGSGIVLTFIRNFLFPSPDEVGNSSDHGFTFTALSGGPLDGRSVINSALENVAHILRPGGLFYIVTIAQNKPRQILQEVEQSGIFHGKIVLNRRAGIEHLYVLRLTKL
ncbi:hypothetical protein BB560_001605 [Smittium megazygosporum]|uniref:Methyltransferase type 11 domain-containing protein n=1 Tax=Smittium megazygosporum TaxID=133381 RepID=A0A2T9ZH27_9FUNG|nr:hypothetical protein BB560_001605 [Smittium megazygosporum]